MDKKRILVLGLGGREHAIAWQLSKSKYSEKIYVCPGNPGMLQEQKVVQASNVDWNNHSQILKFVEENNIDITIVGPEQPLEQGIVDSFKEYNYSKKSNHLIIGPSKSAARLETSKVFAKNFMKEAGIPTANYQVFNKPKEALDYVKELMPSQFPVVIKKDSLAAGKGVHIVNNYEEALFSINEVFSCEGSLVIEEYIEGQEVSFIVATDGSNIYNLATSQDHKQRYEGNRGPNTGGMGAYSPNPIVDDSVLEKINNTVIYPVLKHMSKNYNIDYKGFLYAGLMITKNKDVKVLEFNCRLGDPEAQVILMRLKSDFVEFIYNLANEKKQKDLVFDAKHALGVVMVCNEYPLSYSKGEVITGLEDIICKDVKVFHSGTHKDAITNKIVTNGGRVLCVTALGSNLKEAKELAYQQVSKIKWNGCSYRKDIGFLSL